jgi:Tfp pilus assembly protein PilO
MNKLFDRLNLRPQERRLVVIVAIVVFVVINFWLVIPMFGEFGKNQQRMNDAQKNVDRYQAEISKKQLYQKQLNDLQAQGSSIPSEEAALRLYQEVNSQANLTGLGYTSISQVQRGGGSGGKTNAFFDETSVTVSVRTGEKELIDFLNRLTDKDMMIRAKSMNVSPELPGRNSLQGSITLVKSFQRKPPVAAKGPGPAATRAAAKTNAPAAKPAPVTTPPPKPASTAPAEEKKSARTPPANLPSASMTNRTKRTP